MNVSRRNFLAGSGAVVAATLVACGSEQQQTQTQPTEATGAGLSLDSAAWRYDADDDVYYQLGIAYCEKPANDDYAQLAIIVPGAYFDATDNGNDTYTCQPKADGSAGSFTTQTAPIVMPINTPGYAAQDAMTEYSSQSAFTGEGFVYVHAGCRGRDSGAPAGVTDLKAAVRFLRHVKASIAGDTERIFTFGMSGGGAQSALMGATGDSALYQTYLSAIGAVSDASDAVCGSMCWCPITGLDVADGAYEWMMGCTRSGLSAEDQAISDGLATAYATWVNGAGIPGKDGAALELEASSEGIYQAGSYYDLVRQTIEESLNNFLTDTEFPYEVSKSAGGPAGGAPDGQRPDGAPDNAEGEEQIPAPQEPSGEDLSTQGNNRRAGGPPTTNMVLPLTDEDSDSDPSYEDIDDISRTETSGGVDVSGTYQTAADYIEALNADTSWVTYDESSNTATITSVADFCKALKLASKSLGAFDQLDRGQGENTLFGYDGVAAHFDAMLAEVLEEVGSSYAADFVQDLARTDARGMDVQTRVNMYTPLYYLLSSQMGFGHSVPAKHWRIRSGVEQGDTALPTELNLALTLKAHADVESVDFAAVWGQGHTKAERTGSADDNFIEWVKDCLK